MLLMKIKNLLGENKQTKEVQLQTNVATYVVPPIEGTRVWATSSIRFYWEFP